MKMDNGTASTSKIFQLNDEDIKLLLRLLNEEKNLHVYQNVTHRGFGSWKERKDHIQSLIKELEDENQK
jgi:hypothetical protein